jgi:hypothetical protein
MTADQATKVLNSLLDQREQLLGRVAKLASDRQACAYSAHTGDKQARDKLRKLNDDAVLANAEIEGIDSAIAEATSEGIESRTKTAWRRGCGIMIYRPLA